MTPLMSALKHKNKLFIDTFVCSKSIKTGMGMIHPDSGVAVISKGREGGREGM